MRSRVRSVRPAMRRLPGGAVRMKRSQARMEPMVLPERTEPSQMLRRAVASSTDRRCLP